MEEHEEDMHIQNSDPHLHLYKHTSYKNRQTDRQMNLDGGGGGEKLFLNIPFD